MEPFRPLWRHCTLILLWTAHVFILVPPVCRLYVDLFRRIIARDSPSIWAWIWVFGMIYSIYLECCEILRFRHNRLDAKFYLWSTATRAAVFTWCFGFTMGRMSAMNVLKLSTLYIGFVFALYVWCRQRMHRRSRAEHTSYGDELYGAFCPPPELNSADAIQADGPIAVVLARWVNSDPHVIHRLPAWAQQPLRMSLWAMRLALCTVPIILCLCFTGRMPGEPKNSRNDDTASSMNNWDYARPKLTRGENGGDGVNRSRASSPFRDDEEASVGIASRRTTGDNLAPTTSGRTSQTQTKQRSAKRLLGPRYLCFITHQSNTAATYETQRVEEWMSQHKTHNEPDYVFISYTRQQFYSQISKDPTISAEDLMFRKAVADRDQTILTNYAMKATLQAGVPAFWIDFECVHPEDDKSDDDDMEDVYRICDIVRASHSLVIVSGPQLDEKLERSSANNSTPTEWLLEWGKRLWTLPEALLCPSEHRISIYAVGCNEPEKVAKRNLSSRLWDDAAQVRQLIDHYEASPQLSSLELISIALECLGRRQTEKRNAGDVAYALMGLLRLRPKVNRSDTGFQAFARLSIANDSNMILERLICLQNPDRSASWHQMQDSWDGKLWQIKPEFQIADVGPDNAVIIGDAPGTSIDWTSLKAVDFAAVGSPGVHSWRGVRIASIFAVAFVALVLTVPVKDPTIERVLSLVYTLGSLTSAWIFTGLWRGNISSAQARVFALAGVPDAAAVEQRLFGGASGRLRWNDDGGIPNGSDQEDGRPIFTLVDSLSMTLTKFRASETPTMLFMGGRERGMLRVVLCSFHSATETFVKEAVVRMDSVMETRLPKLDRFRFSVQPKIGVYDRPEEVSVEVGVTRDAYNDDAIELPDIPEFISLD